MWYADGRLNPNNAGKRSLGTKDRNEAIRILPQLDATMAVQLGVADKAILGTTSKSLKVEDGVRAYTEHVARPQVLRGGSAATQKRYRPVFNKFLPFLAARGVTSWQQVTRSVLVSYGSWLEREGYAYRTQSLELTTIVQAVKWMKTEKLLAQDHELHVSMAKPSADSDTYCYTPTEVVAMTAHCFESPGLHWLGG